MWPSDAGVLREKVCSRGWKPKPVQKEFHLVAGFCYYEKGGTGGVEGDGCVNTVARSPGIDGQPDSRGSLATARTLERKWRDLDLILLGLTGAGVQRAQEESKSLTQFL